MPEPDSEPTVPCDSCGRDTPTPVSSGITVPRARCGACEIAVAQALDEVVRQLVSPRTDADALPSMPRGPMTCFDCGAPGVADQETFSCSICGSRCYTRQARTLVAPLSELPR